MIGSSHGPSDRRDLRRQQTFNHRQTVDQELSLARGSVTAHERHRWIAAASEATLARLNGRDLDPRMYPIMAAMGLHPDERHSSMAAWPVYRREQFKGLTIREALARLEIEWPTLHHHNLPLPENINTVEDLQRYLTQLDRRNAGLPEEQPEDSESVAESTASQPLSLDDESYVSDSEEDADSDSDEEGDDDSGNDGDGDDDDETNLVTQPHALPCVGRGRRRTAKKPMTVEEALRYNDDVDIESIVCIGGWKAKSNDDGYEALISVIHQNLNHTADRFTPACRGCVAARIQQPNNLHAKCSTCPTPRLWPQGNPTKDPDFRQAVQKLGLDTMHLTTLSASPLNPLQYRDAIRAMMTHATVYSTMIATMFALSCHLYLRANEVVKLHYDDVEWEKIHIASGIVEAVPFLISGKEESTRIRLWLWRNPKNPEICPVSLFLFWISLSRFRGRAYLFPRLRANASNNTHKNFLKRLPNVDEKHITYSMYDNALMRFLPPSVISAQIRLTTHTGRKTAIFLAMVGGAKDSDMKLDARMESDDTLRKYKGDNATVIELQSLGPNENRNRSHSDLELHLEDFMDVIGEYRPKFDQQPIRSCSPDERTHAFDRVLDSFKERFPRAGSFGNLALAWASITNVPRFAEELQHQLARLEVVLPSIRVNVVEAYDMREDTLAIGPLLEKLAIHWRVVARHQTILQARGRRALPPPGQISAADADSTRDSVPQENAGRQALSSPDVEMEAEAASVLPEQSASAPQSSGSTLDAVNQSRVAFGAGMNANTSTSDKALLIETFFREVPDVLDFLAPHRKYTKMQFGSDKNQYDAFTVWVKTYR
ncbi:hypothetical protein HDU76_006631, partial [Blyttiomyces sp. JEL0837]